MSKERFDPKTVRLGTETPNFILERINEIESALNDCLPYQPTATTENLCLLEVAEREALEIVRYLTAIKGMYGLPEFPSLYDQKENDKS